MIPIKAIYCTKHWIAFHGDTDLLQGTKTGSTAQPASYSSSTGGNFLGDKAARTWSWPIMSAQRLGQEWVELYIYSLLCLHGMHKEDYCTLQHCRKHYMTGYITYITEWYPFIPKSKAINRKLSHLEYTLSICQSSYLNDVNHMILLMVSNSFSYPLFYEYTTL